MSTVRGANLRLSACISIQDDPRCPSVTAHSSGLPGSHHLLELNVMFTARLRSWSRLDSTESPTFLQVAELLSMLPLVQ